MAVVSGAVAECFGHPSGATGRPVHNASPAVAPAGLPASPPNTPNARPTTYPDDVNPESERATGRMATTCTRRSHGRRRETIDPSRGSP